MEVIVKFALVDELGVFCVYGFDLDCDFKVGLCVDGLVDLSEGAFVDLADDFEVFTHFLQHLRHWNIRL